MHRALRYRLLICGCVLAVGAAGTPASAQSGTTLVQSLPLPTELADSTFWRMINTFSEPEQPFTTYLVSNENRFPDLVRPVAGEEDMIAASIFSYNPDHRWWYFQGMDRDDILLFKFHDSDHSRTWRCPHSAFVDSSAAHPNVRESIEVRSVAFWE